MTIPLLLALTSIQQSTLNENMAEASIDLTAPLLIQSPQPNAVLSPANISLTVGMLALTASDQDRPAIYRMMGVTGSDEQVSTALAKLAQVSWTKPADNQDERDAFLRMAFAAYANQGLTLNPTAEERLKTIFAARTGTVNVSDQAALDKINQWFEEQTEGRVKNLLQRDALNGVSGFIASALAVKDQWGLPMNEVEPFTFAAAGGGMQVPGFGGQHTMKHLRKDSGEFVRIRGRNTGTSVILALPRAGKKPADVLQDDALRGVGDWSNTLVRLKVPNWTSETKWSMDSLIQKLQGYRFNMLAGSAAVPDRWMHWTKFSADKDGYEGAAASVVGVITSLPTNPPVMLTFDRPFSYSVVHDETGQVLMLGVVERPETQ